MYGKLKERNYYNSNQFPNLETVLGNNQQILVGPEHSEHTKFC